MAGAIEVLAHQGGWDEALLIATPIALFVFLLRIANKRAATLGDETDPAAHGDTADTGGRTPSAPTLSPGRTAPDRGDT
ncbi:hypothetical protein BH20ACT3_BH20ACT3_09580 [soil metagenome]